MAWNRSVIENVTIEDVKWHGTSVNANPTMRIIATDGREWLTSSDASVGYSASNYRPRPHLGIVCTVDLEVTPYDRVTRIFGPDGQAVYDSQRESN